MESIRQVIQSLIHLDQESMNRLAQAFGPWLYVILFAIIFAETGLVALPFLPGDSLLFAVGALAASAGSPIDLTLTAVLLVIAAVAGDAVNYAIGVNVGPRVFRSESSWLLNKKHLIEAQRFYEQYGGKTVILARFMPLVRTFAPFVAGIGRMSYARFFAYNVVGGLAWVVSFLVAGYAFGRQPGVQKNFKLVILAIIIVSMLPATVEFLRHYWAGRRRQPSTQVPGLDLDPNAPEPGVPGP